MFSRIETTTRRSVQETYNVDKNATHIMNFDWIALLCLDGAVRRRIRRLDIQPLWYGQRLLFRRHEQPESRKK